MAKEGVMCSGESQKRKCEKTKSKRAIHVKVFMQNKCPESRSLFPRLINFET